MLCALIGSGIQYKTLILTYATYTLDLETIANFYGRIFEHTAIKISSFKRIYEISKYIFCLREYSQNFHIRVTVYEYNCYS
jgi:hypothetical protein